MTWTSPSGRTVAYLEIRPRPEGARMAAGAWATVGQGERLDNVAYRTMGDALQAWRIADANDALDPADLVATPGRKLKIPLPTAG